MGAYSPAPVLGPAVHERVMRDVITLTLRGMAQEGHPYRGFLYAGLMIAPDGSPRVLESTAGWATWEAPVLLMRLRSDLVEPLEAALAGRLVGLTTPDWDPCSAGPRGGTGCPGLSGHVAQGRRDHGPAGLPDADTRVFHAGTAADGGAVVTGGGRVACVCARRHGRRCTAARLRAPVARPFEGMYYRRDIGDRAVARERVRS
jgi:phosphoribosylamine--glycine ligase